MPVTYRIYDGDAELLPYIASRRQPHDGFVGSPAKCRGPLHAVGYPCRHYAIVYGGYILHYVLLIRTTSGDRMDILLISMCRVGKHGIYKDIILSTLAIDNPAIESQESEYQNLYCLSARAHHPLLVYYRLVCIPG